MFRNAKSSALCATDCNAPRRSCATFPFCERLTAGTLRSLIRRPGTSRALEMRSARIAPRLASSEGQSSAAFWKARFASPQNSRAVPDYDSTQLREMKTDTGSHWSKSLAIALGAMPAVIRTAGYRGLAYA